jgi:hypothetical protein
VKLFYRCYSLLTRSILQKKKNSFIILSCFIR